MAAKAPKGGDYGYGNGRAYGHRLHCPSYTGMYHSKGRAMCHTAPRRGGVTGAEVPPPGPAQAEDSNVAGRGQAQPANSASSAGNNARANPSAPARAQTNPPPSGGRPEQGPPAPEARDDQVGDDKAGEVKGRGNRNPGGGNGQGPERRRQRP